jgi:hypothetical protein
MGAAPRNPLEELHLQGIHAIVPLDGRYKFPDEVPAAYSQWLPAKWVELLQLPAFDAPSELALEQWAAAVARRCQAARPTAEVFLSVLHTLPNMGTACRLHELEADKIQTLEDVIDHIALALWDKCDAIRAMDLHWGRVAPSSSVRAAEEAIEFRISAYALPPAESRGFSRVAHYLRHPATRPP